jgi:hypothetical protein
MGSEADCLGSSLWWDRGLRLSGTEACHSQGCRCNSCMATRLACQLSQQVGVLVWNAGRRITCHPLDRPISDRTGTARATRRFGSTMTGGNNGCLTRTGQPVFFNAEAIPLMLSITAVNSSAGGSLSDRSRSSSTI